MAQQLDAAQLVLGHRASANDPGGLQRADAAPDQEAVAGLSAVVVLVVELQRLEGVVGVEAIGASDEFRARSHLAAGIIRIILTPRSHTLVPRTRTEEFGT